MTNTTLSLKIVSPTEVVYEGEVDFVVLPGSEGQLGILPNHTPILSDLKEGKIKVRKRGDIKNFDISSGLAEVLKNKITVLLNP